MYRVRGEMAAIRSPAPAADYRRFAAKCLLLAKEFREPTSKEALIAMVAAWQRMAELAEKTENLEPSRMVVPRYDENCALGVVDDGFLPKEPKLCCRLDNVLVEQSPTHCRGVCLRLRFGRLPLVDLTERRAH